MARIQYGTTWWGNQWLNALNKIDYSNRIPRGRNYANKGAVTSIEIEKNFIKAKVKGSRPRPYNVTIEVPVFTLNQKNKIFSLITKEPFFLSQLLNRTLPPELDSKLAEEKIKIFPSSWKDLSLYCSCPDWAVPCKHLAAVLYLLANEIDKNPFIVFQLHDFDILDTLSKEGYSSANTNNNQILSINDLFADQLELKGTYTGFDLKEFKQIDFTTLPELHDNIPAMLPENPAFLHSKLKINELFTKVFQRVNKKLQAFEKNKMQQKIENQQKYENVDDITIYISEEFMLSEAIFESNGELIERITDTYQLLTKILSIPIGNIGNYSTDLSALIVLSLFSLKLAEAGCWIPQIIDLGNAGYCIRWLPALMNEEVAIIYRIIQNLTPPDLVYYKIEKNKTPYYYPAKSDEQSLGILSLFLNDLMHTYSYGSNVTDNPILETFFIGKKSRFVEFEEKEIPQSINTWLSRFYLTEQEFVPVLGVEEADEDEEFGLCFAVQLLIENALEKMKAPIPVHEILSQKQYGKIRLEVLQSLQPLVEVFPDLEELIQADENKSLVISHEDFGQVIFDIMPTLQLYGIRVLLPRELQKLIRPKMLLSIQGNEDPKVGYGSSILSMNSLLRYQWKIAIGDKTITADEFQELVKGSKGIVRIQDHYIYLQDKEIQSLLFQIENPPKMTDKDVIQAALAKEIDDNPVSLDDKARQIIKQIVETKELPVPIGLKADLRPYQQTGYQWLIKNAKIGMGSLIADDMGLGKTIQVISALLTFKQEGHLAKNPALVIVPTTLLTNWYKEIERFAPELSVFIYHGSNRNLLTDQHDVLLTTYGIIRTEIDTIAKNKWFAIIIDEAQNIKNPNTAQTKSVKKLNAPVKIAMSGTPVENRLSEYWSILDFTNKGYLKGLKTFKNEFATPIEVDRDQKRLDKFLRITAPLIMRRVKTDKSIIRDLPDKIETNEYCYLTKEQAALYQNIVDTTMEKIENSEGIDRRGLILKLLLNLKQICNHPSQFLKKQDALLESSGKSLLLIDILREILSTNEKALIFTQFSKMGTILQTMLQDTFGFRSLFLYGKTQRKQRDLMIEQFQTQPQHRVLILSLKAGGTGLNLTAANHVIHYDLWWNPAVEQQATDRAFRIGQEKVVQVHRLICQKTMEEKIDKLIQSKKELADLTIATGEKWIGELSDSELKEIVSL